MSQTTDAIQLEQNPSATTTESGSGSGSDQGQPGPRLTLAVETPSSASPFPSPSSTFFPPPIPSSHEFANRILNNNRYRAKSVGNKDRENIKRIDNTDHTDRTDAADLTPQSLADPPSTRSAGASPANVTTLLPACTLAPPPAAPAPAPALVDSSSTSTSTTPTTSAPTSVLASAPASASSISRSVVVASLPGAGTGTGTVSQSIPPVPVPVLTLVGIAPHNSSVHTSVASVAPSPRPNCNAQRQQSTASYSVTRPGLSDDATCPQPQPHPQSANPYDSLLKLHAQESSTDTITPASTQLRTPVPQRPGDDPDINNDGSSTPVARERPESTASLSTALLGAVSLSRASSLSSSRPAPPSPVPSRRASQQILHRNSTLRRSTSSIASATVGGSNLGRSASTRSTTNKRASTLSMSSLAPPIDTAISGLQVTSLSPTVELQNPAVEEVHPLRPIIVRDFAYPPLDHWFSARPIELLPRSERESKRNSHASRSSRGIGAWGPFSSNSKALGTKSGRKKKKGGWAALGKFLSKRSSGQPESGSEDPSEDEDDEDQGPYEDGDEPIGSESEYDDDDVGSGAQVEEELKPGLYRALYPFEPEGTAEMALVEDQIVRVIARGGGVGWAIVERPPEQGDSVGGFGLEAAGQALVPESYLEPYRLDDEDEYE